MARIKASFGSRPYFFTNTYARFLISLLILSVLQFVALLPSYRLQVNQKNLAENNANVHRVYLFLSSDKFGFPSRCLTITLLSTNAFKSSIPRLPLPAAFEGFASELPVKLFQIVFEHDFSFRSLDNSTISIDKWMYGDKFCVKRYSKLKRIFLMNLSDTSPS